MCRSTNYLETREQLHFGMFAKRPIAGRVKTRLAEEIGAEPAAQIYSAFLNDSLSRLGDIGHYRTIGFAPRHEESSSWFQEAAGDRWNLWPQPAADLGTRMAAYFEWEFQRGADRVVLIGSDSPTIPRAAVETAFSKLANRDCVLGPSADGGYYLIGLAKPAPRLFESVTWSGARVLSQTIERIGQEQLSFDLLPVWYDVDTVDDLQMLAGHLAAMRRAGTEVELAETETVLKVLSRS